MGSASRNFAKRSQPAKRADRILHHHSLNPFFIINTPSHQFQSTIIPMKKHIPNTITCCNLISGCIATYFAFRQDYELALLFIIIGAVFDFFDGFTARLLKVSSPIGKELDSLADDITFGFAPAAIVYAMLVELATTSLPSGSLEWMTELLPFVAFLIAAFSALRLAKFNLDERQTTSFIGLPTPANALFWGGLAYSLHTDAALMHSPWFMLALIVGVLVSSLLLVAEIPMFALKFKTFALRTNLLRYGFILFSAVMLLLLGIGGFPIIILVYVIVSIANNALSRS